MKTVMTRLMLAVAVVFVAAGCPKPPQQVTRKPYPAPYPIVYPSPFLPIPAARISIVPRSQFMKIAVINFVDQTGKSDRAVETLGDMLSTELHASGRFELYDRGQLRHWDYTQLMDACKKAGDKDCKTVDEALGQEANAIVTDTDAFLLGAVTSTGGGSMRIDYRLVNAQSRTVMVAGQAPVGSEITTGGMKIDREAVQRIAQTVKNALPKAEIGKFGRVLVQDGVVLTINLGRNEGIIPGMNVFVVDPGRGAGAAQSVVDEVYLAQAYVVSVYDNTSQVVVFDGLDFRVGDYVRFK